MTIQKHSTIRKQEELVDGVREKNKFVMDRMEKMLSRWDQAKGGNPWDRTAEATGSFPQ